jgi:hypothetical protein
MRNELKSIEKEEKELVIIKTYKIIIFKKEEL